MKVGDLVVIYISGRVENLNRVVCIEREFRYAHGGGRGFFVADGYPFVGYVNGQLDSSMLVLGLQDYKIRPINKSRDTFTQKDHGPTYCTFC